MTTTQTRQDQARRAAERAVRQVAGLARTEQERRAYLLSLALLATLAAERGR